MSDGAKIGLAILAIVAASVTAAVLKSFPFPFYVGLFVVGPFALLWFLLPGLVVPWLVSSFPVNRSRVPVVIGLTAVAFAMSVAYLRFVPTFRENGADVVGVWGLWIAVMALPPLAGAGYLRESRAVTCAYHLILSTWFFAVAFPYLGEFCC